MHSCEQAVVISDTGVRQQGGNGGFPPTRKDRQLSGIGAGSFAARSFAARVQYTMTCSRARDTAVVNIHPMAALMSLGLGGGWLILDRVISGVVQCSALGCLPK